MKLFVKLLGALLIIALAAPFVLRGRDGQPLVRLDQFKLPSIELPGEDSRISPAASSTSMYKWRDEHGGWHFSQQPPEGIDAELIELQDRITPMGGDWVVPAAEKAAEPAPVMANPLQVYGNADEIIKQAQHAADLLDKHHRQVEDAAQAR